MKKFYTLILGVTVMMMSACGSSDILSEISHLPFKSEKDDKWGLISLDGDVLCVNEFAEEPSAVVGGLFRLPVDNQLELYAIEGGKPKLVVEKRFKQLGLFYGDLAPAVERDGYITLINKKGEAVVTLSKYKELTFEGLNICYAKNGLAIVRMSNEKYGLINKKGEMVVEPTYDFMFPGADGAVCAVNEGEKTKITLIDNKGNVTGTIDMNDTKVKNVRFTSDGVTLIQTKYDDKEVWTSYNDKGEKATTFASKITDMGTFNNGVAFMREDNGLWGLVDKAGEVKIRAKYDKGVQILDNSAIFKNKDKIVYVTFDDEKIAEVEFSQILPYFNGKTTFADERGRYVLIDNEGKVIGKQNYYMVDEKSYDYEMFKSDYFDIEGVVNAIVGDLNTGGRDNVKFGQPVEEVINVVCPTMDVIKGKSQDEKWSASEFMITDDAYLNTPKAKLQYSINFNGFIYGTPKYNNEAKLFSFSVYVMANTAETASEIYRKVVTKIKDSGTFEVVKETDSSDASAEFKSKTEANKKVYVRLSGNAVSFDYMDENQSNSVESDDVY